MSLSLAENVIVAGADNRPPMLDKTQYSSWASRMLLYIKGKEHGKLLVDSVLNKPFHFRIIIVPEDETTSIMIRERTYIDLIDEEKLHESIDINATNIVLKGLPQYIYNSVNHNEHAKQIWDRVKLLIQGSELSLQERESKLSKSATDVKLARDTYSTSFDHLYAYLRQHEAYGNEYYPQHSLLAQKYYSSPASQWSYDVHMVQQSSYQPQVANPSPMVHHQPYQAPAIHQQAQASFPQLDLGLTVPSFLPSNDLISNGQSYCRQQFRDTQIETNDLDAFDSDCDDAPLAKEILMDNLSSYDLNVLSKHLICQDVLNVIMHANIHSHNVLPANNNSLEHDNFASELLKHENDCLMEMLISQDLGHTVELLVYVSATCPSLKHVSDKLVGVTPINKTREVRSKQFSEASGSKPRNNTKKDRITQTSSSNKKKNKVEDHPRIAKSSLNNMNRVSKPVCNANVKHSVLNANSKLICATAINVVQIVLCHLDSGCSNHMTGQRSQLINFVSQFLGIVRFGNDQIANTMGYCDYQLGNVTISQVYYVEGLGHNLFSVGQFCDINLEVAFEKHTCYVWNLNDADFLFESRDTNLYTILLDDMLNSSPICLLYKASKTKCWLWNRWLSHFKHRKSKKHSHKPKAEDTNQEKLNLLHMDLCGPMRVESINGKKYILVIVDEYLRFMWVKFLRSNDESPETLKDYYENVGITHQTSVARTLQQNNVVERWNQTLVEVTRTMLIFSKAPFYLWAEGSRQILLLQHLVSHRQRMIGISCSNQCLMSSLILHQVLFLVPATVAQRPTDPTSSPVSTLIEQDSPSVSTSSNKEQAQSLVFYEDVEEQFITTHFNDDPFHEILHEDSTSRESSLNV
ncbi:retrovirus-related pol polyprotein from transposon TNT 1-94 [Tanacetum coccineum]